MNDGWLDMYVRAEFGGGDVEALGVNGRVGAAADGDDGSACAV